MGRYKKPSNYIPPDDTDDGEMTDGEIKGFIDGTIDNVAATMMRKAESRAIAKLAQSNGGDYTPGRYSSKGWSPAFGGISGESSTITSIKALNTGDSEAAERAARVIHDMTGFTGERLDANVLADRFFRTATIAQLPRHRGFHAASMVMEKFEDIATKAAMFEATAASGGATVPTIVANEVLKIIRDASLIYSRARQIPMTSNVMNFPDENTAVSTNWVSEGGTLTAGEPLFGTKVLTAKKIAGRAVFSIELLDDANVAIVPFLQTCFAEKIGGELDFQAMEGPGTVFSGVSVAVSVGDAGGTNTTNGVVLTYASTATTKASLVKIFCNAGEGITRNDGIWVCGPAVYAQIIGLTDTNGQPIVRLGTVEGQPNNTLFGRPIIVSNRLPKQTVGAGPVSTGNLYYGSPSALMFGVRQTMKWDVTDQVSWSTYQADCRLVGRFAYIVGVPTAWSKQVGIVV